MIRRTLHCVLQGAALDVAAVGVHACAQTVTHACAGLQEELAAHEKSFTETLDAVDTSLDDSAADFRGMDSTTSSLAAAAATTGTRLAAAHRVTATARSALSVLGHLAAFSELPAAAMDVSPVPPPRGRGAAAPADGGTVAATAGGGAAAELDPVFHDNARLSEAAALVQRMLPLARELRLSNLRLGLAPEEMDDAAPGTVDAALRNLLAYRNNLENRLLSRFMDACTKDVRPRHDHPPHPSMHYPSEPHQRRP